MFCTAPAAKTSFWEATATTISRATTATTTSRATTAMTTFRAARATLVVWATVYFVYDLSGYLFARIMQDPSNGIHMPVGYTYWDWFREPFAVKWYVLGFVPIIRYMPVIFGLFAGSLLHVFILDVTYPIALAVFLAALAMVSTIRYDHVVNRYLLGRRSFPYIARLVIIAVVSIWWFRNASLHTVSIPKATGTFMHREPASSPRSCSPCSIAQIGR